MDFFTLFIGFAAGGAVAYYFRGAVERVIGFIAALVEKTK